ncbi:DUF937 domain-containing protein [Methylobacterium sp. WCS2018Hpa-22]|uniref:DUF937 domain-containing protein n=1 Tax=Methylobacterium sp. WCS2018Hpa-22 TaxID=3073633 RepID=UPI00288A86C0|nr:DUF937 domain-containing protein [Methylobacterium sp. WCS2018Hpa-22]
MFNLFDLLQAQGGMDPNGFMGPNGFGQQFGLSPDQTRRAMEALMPALTLGLQRNAAADPTGFTQMFSFMDPAALTAPQAKPQMDAMMRQLFGSQHLSQAVLQQAAAVSGVATPALRQMLPLMAGMVVAGIVHVMMNPGQPAPQPAPPPPSPFGIPTHPYWTEMMNGFMKASGAMLSSPMQAAAPARTAPAQKSLPPARLFPAARPAQDSSPTPESRQASAGAQQGAALNPFDLLQQMFQSGLEVQQENARTMQSLFDSLWRDGMASVGSSKANNPTPNRPGQTRR